MKFDPNSTSAELKLNLIELILKLDLENLKRNKLGTNKYKKLLSILKIDINEEIEKEIADQEVAKMEDFISLNTPQYFLIRDIKTVFDQNKNDFKHLHIYFIKNVAGISLLFRFNNDSENDSVNVDFSSDETLYQLDDEMLKHISTNDAKMYISNFKKAYENSGFNDSQFCYTQYVTFETFNIDRNFKNFPPTTKFLAAAKNDPIDGRLRQNIIFQIETSYVKNPVTLESVAFFNIGNMQP